MKKISFGEFTFKGVYITDISNTYNGAGCFLKIVNPEEPGHFIGVMVSRNMKYDLTRLRDAKTLLNLSGEIVKNAATEKTLFIIDDTAEGLNLA